MQHYYLRNKSQAGFQDTEQVSVLAGQCCSTRVTAEGAERRLGLTQQLRAVPLRDCAESSYESWV